MSHEPSIISGAFEKMQKEAADNYRRWEELEKWLDQEIKEAVNDLRNQRDMNPEAFNINPEYDEGFLKALEVVAAKVQVLGPVKKRP